MPKKQSFSSQLYTGKLGKLEWNHGFNTRSGRAYQNDAEWMAAKQRFSVNANRIDVLKNTNEYKEDRIWGVLYGAMVRRVVGGKENEFLQPAGSDIVAVQLVWYVDTSGTKPSLSLKAVSLDKFGRTSPQPDPAGLYDFLKNNNQVVESISIPTTELLILLGFSPESLPSHTVDVVIFYPVIVDLMPILTTRPYFALATKADGFNDKPYAFGPPCPPFCYG